MSFKVVGIGEALWDLLPAGPQLGGAPVNFAYHAGQMGAQVRVVTRIGDDLPGRKMLEQFGQMGIQESGVQVDPHWPTGTTDVVLDPAGVPQFTIKTNAAWDRLEFTNEALDTVRWANALCFGSLAQREPAAATTIQRLVAAAPRGSWRVFDINLRQNFYTKEMVEQSLAAANVLKLNEHELRILSNMFGLPGDIPAQIERLVQRFGLEVVALTLGNAGSLLHRAGAWSEAAGRKVDVVDTIGAGDAFTAGLIMGLLHCLPLDESHRIAADLAAFVCSQPGATPILPAHLRAAFLPNCTSV